MCSSDLGAGACCGEQLTRARRPRPKAQDSMLNTTGEELRRQFGDIDIYLFDQILRGRFDARRRVLDAGCGDGRNLIYFLQQGFDCHGVDSAPQAIDAIRQIAARVAPRLSPTNFVVSLPTGPATITAFLGAGAEGALGMSVSRSEERRVGKECRSRWSPYH